MRDGWRIEDDHELHPLTEDECLEDTVDADALIKYIVDHKDSITHVHFQGGEPFMMPEVYKTLDNLIKHDMHKEDGIHIWCHTNGSIRTFRDEDIIKKYLLKWEDRFHITMSHDGMGNRGEYIRYGYRDKKWLDIFRRINDAGCRMNIHHSLNIFNLLHQEECLEWYHENVFSKMKEGKEIGVTIQPWGGLFKFENIGYVPELVDNAITQFENCVKFLTPHWREKQYSQYLPALYDLRDNGIAPDARFSYEDNDSTRHTFIRAVNKFDEMRKTDFHKTFPELKLFWEYCS